MLFFVGLETGKASQTSKARPVIRGKKHTVSLHPRMLQCTTSQCVDYCEREYLEIVGYIMRRIVQRPQNWNRPTEKQEVGIQGLTQST